MRELPAHAVIKQPKWPALLRFPPERVALFWCFLFKFARLKWKKTVTKRSVTGPFPDEEVVLDYVTCAEREAYTTAQVRAQEKKTIKCSLVSTTSTRSFKDKFLGLPKQQRGAFILMFCSSEPVKRRRTTDTGSPVGSRRHTRYASTTSQPQCRHKIAKAQAWKR